MAFWYHFAILFEALFILAAVDAGTRAGRCKMQNLLSALSPSLKRTESSGANLIASSLCVAAWGYFLYQGVVDPLGGINTLWRLFGIANQMLASIALILAEDFSRQHPYRFRGARSKIPSGINQGVMLAPAKNVFKMERLSSQQRHFYYFSARKHLKRSHARKVFRRWHDAWKIAQIPPETVGNTL